jgi:hypothetical protein
MFFHPLLFQHNRWALGIPQSSSDQTSAELLDRFTSACLGEMDVLPTKKSRLEEKWVSLPSTLFELKALFLRGGC